MISIICPSRDRPNELFKTLKSFELKKHGLEALVWVDSDDPQLKKYKELFGTDPNIRLFIKDRVGYKNFQVMVNFLCKQAKFDWIMLFNDDAYFEKPEWFSKFQNFVREFEPSSQPVEINIWGQGDTRLDLFPIVSRKLVELLGHFSLIHLCDEWMRRVALTANVSYNLNGIKPGHLKSSRESQMKDKTTLEVNRDLQDLRYLVDPRRSPYRQQIKADAQKIINYNKSYEAIKNSQRVKTVGFIGLGKLGLPVAEAIAKRGFKVIGYDIKKVETTLPTVHSISDLVKQSDIVFCAVQTPHNPLYEGDKPLPKERADFDYSYLIAAVKEVVATGERTNLVVISTCLPGTFNREIKPLLTDKINYIYNPFFIAMGTVVEDFLDPEFALIGGSDPAILKFFYSKLYGRDRTFVTDITTAEGIKVFYNTFITTKTVLGNMYGEYSHKLGMNVDHIYKALSLATDRIISSKYLKAGMADGGGCHPRDNIALSFLANKIGLSFNYFDSLMMAREKHVEWLSNIFVTEISKSGLLGIIFGKSFKPEVNMQTGSAAILLANILKQKNIAFYHCEFDYPKVLPKAVYFIATQHAIYKDLPYPEGSIIIDPFRYINKKDGVKIIRIGGETE